MMNVLKRDECASQTWSLRSLASLVRIIESLYAQTFEPQIRKLFIWAGCQVPSMKEEPVLEAFLKMESGS
jgi:hypothetical protein